MECHVRVLSLHMNLENSTYFPAGGPYLLWKLSVRSIQRRWWLGVAEVGWG